MEKELFESLKIASTHGKSVALNSEDTSVSCGQPRVLLL